MYSDFLILASWIVLTGVVGMKAHDHVKDLQYRPRCLLAHEYVSFFSTWLSFVICNN